MKQVLIFAGTTEGRQISKILADSGISCRVCVATEYGSEMIKLQEGLEVLEGRLNQDEMSELMFANDFLAVIDATHPFATEVSKNIKCSAQKNGIPYLRLKRRTDTGEISGNTAFFSDARACAKALENTEGKILLTTGSKNLSTFTQSEALKKRLMVRVLPGVESIEKCREAGVEPGQILALQGPFSEEMNRTFIREYKIKHLVTKESGQTGGYPEKVRAAIGENIRLYVLENPEKEPGLTTQEICLELEKLMGMKLQTGKKLSVSLIGTGMGSMETLTIQAEKAIREADVVFGARRLLEFSGSGQKAYPYYLAEDIIPVLDEMLKEEKAGKEIKAAVLFSGDSGFYSGCEKMYEKLKSWSAEKKKEIKAETDIHIYPGISSLSYFSSRTGISWQDALVLSLHGKTQDEMWKAGLLEGVRTNRKTFLLLSGLKDIKAVGALLEKAGLLHCRILYGYQLSYDEEEILSIKPEDCKNLTKEGLYVCFIENPQNEEKKVTHGRKDRDFLREKVPMTKEEVREAAICKLGLTRDAVVYDVGSGTGSIAIEMAERSGGIKVYAIEKKKEAAELIRKNCEKFHLENVEVIEDKAPEGLEGLPAPGYVFIGGSSGNLSEILKCIYRKNSRARIVITAISLETVSELTGILRKFPVEDEEIVQIQVSRSKKAGAYNLMQAENPVYICSFCFKEQF